MIRQYKINTQMFPEEESFDELTQRYKRNAIDLCVLAQEVPVHAHIRSVDEKEDGLMNAQAEILKAAWQRRISTQADINSALELWYESTVKESCAQDLSASDRLILSIYQNRRILV